MPSTTPFIDRCRRPRRFFLCTSFALSGCPALPVDRTQKEASAAPIRLRDVASEAGLRFSWGHDGRSPLTNLETFGCGCAFLDFDSDGWQDILLVGEPRSALFRNPGNGTFADISAASGLDRYTGLWKGHLIPGSPE